jgi:hypothetical protein
VVMHFLVIYDRHEGRLLHVADHDTADSALSARFEAERKFRNRPDVEVVVLGADSREALHRTHSRYFKGVRQLAQEALDTVARA